jgi:para-nitrobenzyl esterase
VRRNIAAFGGDPHNVTLFGQSAGAFSVCAQLATPGARGLFDKATVQSGPCGTPFVTRAVATARGEAIAARLGCRPPGDVADCLRGKPLADLADIGNNQVLTPLGRLRDMPWLPVAGTPALPEQPLAALRDGRAAAVPLVQGSTRDEAERFGMGPAAVLGQDLAAIPGPAADGAVADLAARDRKMGNGHGEAVGT